MMYFEMGLTSSKSIEIDPGVTLGDEFYCEDDNDDKDDKWEGREGRGTLVIIGRVCANYTPYAYYIARIIYLFATYTLFSWPTLSYIQAQKSA